MTDTLAQADVTHGLPRLGEWMVWGPLGVLFGAVLLVSLVYFFSVTLPGARRKQDREDKESESRSAALTKIGDATEQIAASHGRQTQLLGSVVETQHQHGNLLEEIKRAIAQRPYSTT